MPKVEVFDFETIIVNGKTKPYAIAYSNNGCFYYELVNNASSVNAALLFLDITKSGYIYYAHNLKFDFWLIVRPLFKLGVCIKWTYLDDNLYSVNLTYKTKKIYLRCSFKLLPFALDKFYPSLATSPKLKFPYGELSCWDSTKLLKDTASFELFDKKYHNYTLGEYLKVYALTDVKILMDGLTNLNVVLIQNGLNGVKSALTSGSLAMNFFKKKYNTLNLNLKEDFVLRNAYHGGRCEVFGNPEASDQVLHFDFKGMYQQCMMENLPCGNFVYKNVKNIDLPGFYLIKAKVSSKYPVLPIKKNKLIFPEGIIEGWYWFEEINLALNHNQLQFLEIHAAYLCEKYEPFLKPFVETLGAIRDTNGYKDVGKLLINSFYGRLAIKEIFETIKILDCPPNEGEFCVIEDVYLCKQFESKKNDANVAIAAAITAKARIRLYSAIQAVLQNNGKILYCDTDSIFAAFDKHTNVTDRLLNNCVFFNTLKFDTVINDAVFIAPKTYGLLRCDGSEMLKIKGITNPLISFAQLKTDFYAKKHSFIFTTTITTKHDFEIKVQTVNKAIAYQQYDKRVWTFCLKDTNPIKLTKKWF